MTKEKEEKKEKKNPKTKAQIGASSLNTDFNSVGGANPKTNLYLGIKLFSELYIYKERWCILN